MRVPFAREGYPFIFGSLALVALSCATGGRLFQVVTWVIAAFVLNFFRDPERQTPADERAIIAPADGRVIKVERVTNTPFADGEVTLVSIFMSPLDVHVNRNPISGRVISVRHQPGSFLRAYADEASLQNELNAVVVEDEHGRRVCYVQVAGFVARRIVCHLHAEDRVRRGERYGMIRFGSRADIYLPTSAETAVQVGDRTTAGATVLARWT